MLIVNDRLKIPLREFQFTFARSSGPGGQNVNKVNSKALLRWSVVTSRSLPDDVRERLRKKYPRRITQEGDLLIHSQRFRDAGRNVADCLEKLRAMLAEVATAPKQRRMRTKLTVGAKRRRLDLKRRQSEKKRNRRSVGDGD